MSNAGTTALCTFGTTVIAALLASAMNPAESPRLRTLRTPLSLTSLATSMCNT
ncbi:hypothetical protein F441_10964 [Phytophthora nicotianae CJ01A1]|uniref:Uncharacterized protein n=1 Tax=Phytophthora nicotianae CJ01A1 TaxID=1317063 RepID=W2WU78_PHYNI|nr:hypothetical protein F441_10964 [Phytophthora nicotianae CJ01A1]